MASKEELKNKFVPKYKVTAQDMKDVLDVAGKKGAKGAPGDDGFGTEEQYNDIISRLEALESDTTE